MSPEIITNPASFRDTSGFVFTADKEIFRAIAPAYFDNFSLFIKSGLYQSLYTKNFIVPHTETENFLSQEFSAFKVIKPGKIPFISYPYEWSFSQLKDAALLTIKILKESLKHEMILKDASAYNIQFNGVLPFFIDTLSFEKYEKDSLWKAYGQFCRHFLAPLALMSYQSAGLSKLLLNYIDGIQLELASSLLPRRALLNSGIMTHVFLHSKIQKKHSGTDAIKSSKASLPKSKLLAMIQHLEDCIQSLKIKPSKSNWLGYTLDNVYSAEAIQAKEKTVSGWLNKIKPTTVWDAGCNTGKFSLLASQKSEYVLAMDVDEYCIENLYTTLKESGTKNILPLNINLSNPSPSIGWANKERETISQRGKADALIALALLHHLRIGNNVPFSMIAEYFSTLTQHLLIEFIPKDDSNVKLMMAGRESTFVDYTEENFISAFGKHFTIDTKQALPGIGRILYFLKKKN